jgi:hypothetical protein
MPLVAGQFSSDLQIAKIVSRWMERASPGVTAYVPELQGKSSQVEGLYASRGIQMLVIEVTVVTGSGIFE